MQKQQCPECRALLEEVELVPSGKLMLECDVCGYESLPYLPQNYKREFTLDNDSQ